MLAVKVSDVIQFFSLNSLLNDVVSLTPEKIAIKVKDTEITYEALQHRINALAGKIHDAGVEKGDIVALFLDRNEEMIIAMLACLKAGCAFFPISLNIPLERLEYLLIDSSVKKVISHPAIFPTVLKVDLIVPTYDVSQDDFFQEDCDPHNIAYLLYTSGSTGLPKGVLIEYHSMMNLFKSLTDQIGFSSSDVFLALTDYAFDVSLIELLLPLILGATVVIAESGAIVDGHRIQTYLDQYAITVMQATPTTWELLLKSGWRNEGHFKILVGGEIFHTYLANQLGCCQKNIWNLYGPTETTMWSTLYHLDQSIKTISVPIGKPLDNTEALVLDEALNPTTEGELYIGGAGVARSYLNRPELTNSKFVTPDDTGTRYYKTGDLVKWLPDGNLLFLNRTDDQIKIGGVRVEPGEVENVLMSHPMVQKAVVVAQGEGYCKSLVAFIEYDETKVYKEYRAYYENVTVHNWQAIYDVAHELANKNACYHGINTIGWMSALNQKLISAEELEENLILLTNKLKHVNLDRVLEVGCGVGNVLRQLKNHFNYYTGLDISPVTIAQLQENLEDEVKQRCELFASSVQDFRSHSKYTCIIANSVIQYFPSSYYLLEIIEKLINLTEEGGCIVFGDVRSSEMLELFFSLKDQNKEEGRKLKHYLKAKEEELILPSQFFHSLIQHFSRVTHVDIDVKRGSFNNELNIFRFDAVIYLDVPIEKQKPTYINWTDAAKHLPELLSRAQDEVIHIAQVPNIFLEKALQELYTHDVGLPYVSVPDDEKAKVMFLANQTINEKFSIYFDYDHADPWDHLQVILNPHSVGKLIRGESSKVHDVIYPVREPFSPALSEHLAKELNQYAANNLPHLLCPSYYYWVDRWPVTNNQKIDRKMLASIKYDGLISQESGKKIDILHRLYFKVMNQFIPAHVPILSSGISSLTIHHFLHLLNEEFDATLKLADMTKNLTMEELLTILE